jgi:hypothetical protein
VLDSRECSVGEYCKQRIYDENTFFVGLMDYDKSCRNDDARNILIAGILAFCNFIFLFY